MDSQANYFVLQIQEYSNRHSDEKTCSFCVEEVFQTFKEARKNPKYA